MRYTVLTAGLVAFLVALPAWGQGKIQLRVVAATGQRAPGGQGPLDQVDVPLVNNAGQVAFSGRMPLPGGKALQAAWVGAPEALQLVAKDGDAAPGVPADKPGALGGVELANLADDGAIHLRAFVGAGTKRDWFGLPKALVLLPEAMDTAKRPAGSTYGDAYVRGLFSKDHVLVSAHVRQPVEPREQLYLWAGAPGDSQAIIDGQATRCPGINGAAWFLRIDALGNANRHILIAGQYKGPVNSGRIGAEHREGKLQTLVTPQQATELGLKPGAAGTFAHLGINAAGQRVVSMSGGADAAIVSDAGGALAIIARKNSPAAGLDGVSFGPILGRPAIGGGGHVVFDSGLGGPGGAGKLGLLTTGADAKGLTLICREGAAVPGQPEGTKFMNLAALFPFCINKSGQVLFHARFGQHQPGVFLYDPKTGLHSVVAAGQSITINGKALKVQGCEIQSGFTGGQDGRPRALNDAGQAAVKVTCDDGTMAIVLASFGQ